jgi:6,7-dimethyl-8-ribityllumazine synthase
MPNTYEASATAIANGRLAIVVARFNPSITTRLLEGALTTLIAHGVADERIDVARVPGAFEIPTVAEQMAASGRYAAVICLGAVIRGETSHDQHINRAVSTALAEIGVRHRLPVIFGVLTCNTLEQAIARSGGRAGTKGKDSPDARPGNKGAEAAEAALEMVGLLAKLSAHGIHPPPRPAAP